MQIGDKIIWTGSLDTDAGIKEGIVTKIHKDTCWVDNYHKPEDCIYVAYTWPITAKQQLIAILIERRMLKKAFDDSIQLLYQLRNKVSRGEL